MSESEYEVCISCGKTTNIPVSKHIDYRTGYIEGVGQLCYSCNKNDGSNFVAIFSETILSTPNDSDLGKIVRELYWKNKNK